MLSLMITKNALIWIEKNLKNYEINNTNKQIYKHYREKRFELLIYNNMNSIIKGEKEYVERLYQKIISESNEQDFIGCDEVGVGDFFGPVVYVAVYLDNISYNFIKNNQLHINDSKKLKDNDILDIYQQINKKVSFEYSIIYDKDIKEMNSVEQKVFYHYQNITKLEKQNKDEIKKVIVDLFTTEKAFNKYSLKHDFIWPQTLILETKADSKYLCVALASIIARALFIKEMKRLSIKYNMHFPYGAGQVKETANQFIDKYSKKELAKFAKTSFKTFLELDDK